MEGRGQRTRFRFSVGYIYMLPISISLFAYMENTNICSFGALLDLIYVRLILSSTLTLALGYVGEVP